MMCIAPGQLDKQGRYSDSLQKEEGNQIPVPWLLQRERGTGTTSEGADGGVTLRERSGRREGRDTAAMPIYFFSGHVDIEQYT